MNSPFALRCVAITFLLLCASNALAQEKNPKYEVGLHYAALRISEKSDTDSGLGVRAGKRNSRYGIFAKVRPGVTRFYSLSRTGLNFFEQDRDRLTVDVGGVFEYYPHRNVAVRVDAGDTMVHFKTGDFFFERLDQPMFVQRK